MRAHARSCCAALRCFRFQKAARDKHTLSLSTLHSGALDLQYSNGEVRDSHAFGLNFASGTILKATCAKGSGISRLQWRRGKKVDGPDDQAWKPSGVQIYCGTE